MSATSQISTTPLGAPDQLGEEAYQVGAGGIDPNLVPLLDVGHVALGPLVAADYNLGQLVVAGRPRVLLHRQQPVRVGVEVRAPRVPGLDRKLPSSLK